MSELSGPADRSLMRVSDADRERAAEVLREAAGQGRISMDELDERVELAYAAKTYADLAAVTRDLPQEGAALSPLSGTAPASRIGGTPGSKFSLAIMSGARRAGACGACRSQPTQGRHPVPPWWRDRLSLLDGVLGAAGLGP